MGLECTATAGNRSPGHHIRPTAQHHQGSDHSEAEEHPSARVDIKGDRVAAEGDQGLRGCREDVSSSFCGGVGILWPGMMLD